MAVVKSTRREAKSSRMPAILAALLTVMACSYVLMLMFYEIPANNKEVVLVLGGQLSILWATSINYYYNSTSGSKNKDQLLADSVQVQRKEDESP